MSKQSDHLAFQQSSERHYRAKGTCRSVKPRKTDGGAFAVFELVSPGGRARSVFIALPEQDRKEALKCLRSFVGCELSLDADRSDGYWRGQASSIASPPQPKYTLREQLQDGMRRALPVARVGHKRATKPPKRQSLIY